MLEATITKAVVIQDKKAGGTVLMAVAEYLDEMMNIKAAYDWETIDVDGFISDLREKIAEGFDLPLKNVDVREKWLLLKMKEQHYYFKGLA